MPTPRKRDGLCANGCVRFTVPGSKFCPECDARARATAPDLFSQPPDVVMASPPCQQFSEKTRPSLPRSIAEQGAAARGSTTSERARRILAENGQALTQLARVYKRITIVGDQGMTRAELATSLGMRLGSVCVAVRNLYRMGYVGSNEGATRRDPESGMDVEVLVGERHVTRWQGVPRRQRTLLDGARCDLADEREP